MADTEQVNTDTEQKAETASAPVAAPSPAPETAPVAAPVAEPRPAALEPLTQDPQPGKTHTIDLIMDVSLEVTVEFGRAMMSVKDILNLGVGSIIELDKAVGDPVDILVNGKLIAKGEVVVIDDNFGVRLTSIINASERLGELS